MMCVSVALQTLTACTATKGPQPPLPPPPPPLLSFVLQASEILRRIERFLNADNDPDADTFLLCYSGHGSSDGGKWCCDDKSYVTFEDVVRLWQVGSRS